MEMYFFYYDENNVLCHFFSTLQEFQKLLLDNPLYRLA